MSIQEEIWKDVKGYEGKYQVSNLGRIKSFSNDRSRKEKILKQTISSSGYFQIHIGFTKNVHRIVADHFIENPNGYKTVDHINGNKTDNGIDNLEWVTLQENLKRYWNTSPLKFQAPENKKEANVFEQAIKEGRELHSSEDVAKMLGVTRRAVSYHGKMFGIKKVGTNYMFSDDDIENIKDRQKIIKFFRKPTKDRVDVGTEYSMKPRGESNE